MTKASQLAVIMGVSGCGKSTVAEALATHKNWRFVEADNYHTPEAKRMMSEGIPLTDEIRDPWIDSICQAIKQYPQQSCVLAYSGLKARHRNKFTQLGFDCCFFHLQGSKDTIAERMLQRKGHYMSIDLLDSQFAAMEQPTKGEAIISISITLSLQQILTAIESHL